MKSLLVALALFASAILWIACGTTTKVEGKTETPLGTLKWNVSLGTLDGVVAPKYAGWCVDADFVDPEKGSLGKTSAGVGKGGVVSIPVPKGVKEGTVLIMTFYWCEDEAAQGQSLALATADGIHVMSIPLHPGASFRAYGFTVDASSPGEAQTIVDGILAAGTSQPLPAGVRLHYWVEGKLALGEARAWSYLPVPVSEVKSCELTIGYTKPVVLLKTEGAWTRGLVRIPLRTLSTTDIIGELVQQTSLDPVPVTVHASYTLE